MIEVTTAAIRGRRPCMIDVDYPTHCSLDAYVSQNIQIDQDFLFTQDKLEDLQLVNETIDEELSQSSQSTVP